MVANLKKRYKVVAAPIGADGSYRAWPDKTTYVRHFNSEARRNDYWRRFVKTKTTTTRGLQYQLAMIDEWSGGWEFVDEARYSDEPVIGKKNLDPSIHIVETGYKADCSRRSKKQRKTG